MTNHAENVRETYRRQGEARLIEELLTKLGKNSGVTVDYIMYYLQQRGKQNGTRGTS